MMLHLDMSPRIISKQYRIANCFFFPDLDRVRWIPGAYGSLGKIQKSISYVVLYNQVSNRRITENHLILVSRNAIDSNGFLSIKMFDATRWKLCQLILNNCRLCSSEGPHF